MKRFIFCLSICCILFLSGIQNADAKSGSGWEKCFGTKTNSEWANDICRVTDGESGGYIAVGAQYDTMGRMSAYIVKMNASGTVEWSGTYRGPKNSQNSTAYSIARYYDGYNTYFFVTGTIMTNGGQDIFLVKYRLDYPYNLTKVWENACLGGVSFNTAYKITKVGYANHFALTGVTDYSQMCVLEIRSDGSVVDSFTLIKDELSSSVGYSIVELGSYYYVCGKAVMNDGNAQVLWTELYQNGENFVLMLLREFGGSYTDIGYSITKGPSNGSTTIAGKYGQAKDNSDYWVLTIDSSGNEDSNDSQIWGDPNCNEELHSIDVDYYGYYIVAGRADLDPNPSIHYNAYLAILYSNGTVQWHNYYGGSQDAGSSFVRTTGTVNYIALATNETPGTLGNGDVYIVRYSRYK
jgi:hypothetical protein